MLFISPIKLVFIQNMMNVPIHLPGFIPYADRIYMLNIVESKLLWYLTIHLLA